MTSSTRNHRSVAIRRGARRSGFTLMELLVVIGIILILMSLLLPGLNKAWKTATRDRMQSDLQAISMALEAYRGDFDGYPQIITPGRGADTLFVALIGQDYDPPANPNDPKLPVGKGFRTRLHGKLWGPYLPPDRFKLNTTIGVAGGQILDRYKHPILYYPAKKGPGIVITNPGGFMGPHGMFNPNDNTFYRDPPLSGRILMPALTFQMLMGDTGGVGPGQPAKPNGQIDPNETPAYTGNYVLWSAGPDEVFGPTRFSNQPVSARNPCDDVANFPRAEY